MLYQAAHLEQAEEQARKAIELEPDRVSAYMVLYGIHVSAGDLAQAKDDLDKARALLVPWGRRVRVALLVLVAAIWIAGDFPYFGRHAGPGWLARPSAVSQRSHGLAQRSEAGTISGFAERP